MALDLFKAIKVMLETMEENKVTLRRKEKKIQHVKFNVFYHICTFHLLQEVILHTISSLTIVIFYILGESIV